MTVEYLAYQLIDGYGKDDLITSFLDDYDFYLIPFVNPDGQYFPLAQQSQLANLG
jgi:murein tripeptide amidase MpaA